MASEPSHVGGVKRPAAATLDDAAAFSTEDGPISIAGQQRQQRPRLADPDTREDGVDDTTFLHAAPLYAARGVAAADTRSVPGGERSNISSAGTQIAGSAVMWLEELQPEQGSGGNSRSVRVFASRPPVDSSAAKEPEPDVEDIVEIEPNAASHGHAEDERGQEILAEIERLQYEYAKLVAKRAGVDPDPLLDEEGQELGEGAGDVDDGKTYVGNVGKIDITCRVACFMDTGQGLRNMCIAVGPADAAIIRNKYLLKNDAYLVKWLRRLHAIMGNAAEMGQAGWNQFKDNLHVFDKCRDGVVAWMVVNSDWKKRCASAKIEAYKRSKIPFEADVIFNNPVVAIEIGSVDVVKFLIEEKGIDVNTSLWAGFNSGGFHMNSPDMEWPIEVALVRGDADILKQILYADGFFLTRFMHEDGRATDILADMIATDILADIIEFSTRPCVNIACFRCLISHPNVDLNHYSYGRSPLGWILTRYVLENESDTRSVMLSRLRMLLEEGANPHRPIFSDDDRTCIEYARARYERAGSATKARWKDLLQVLERPVL